MTTPNCPLATADQRDAEQQALRLIETPVVRAAREKARATLVSDPIARTPDGRLGLDRALDQWVLALAMRLVNSDEARPKIVWNIFNVPRIWLGHTYPGAAVAIDNPDNANREIPIDGSSRYEIRGQYGAPSSQLTFEMVTDFDHYAGLGKTVAALTSQQIETAADGSFVVTVNSDAHDGPNHMRTQAGQHYWLFSRDSMGDWKQVPTRLAVTRVGGPPPPAAPDEDELAHRIADAMPGWINFWRTFKDDFLGNPKPNVIVGPIARPGGWGYQAGGRFQLADDEALVVTTTDGGAPYTGMQISDPWTLSPDPLYRTPSLNKAQAMRNADGSYTYVIALRDPGVWNWIDTVGLHEGWYMLRWQGVPPQSDPKQLIRGIRLVKLADLDAALPAGMPRIDLAGRTAQIAARVSDYAKRLDER